MKKREFITILIEYLELSNGDITDENSMLQGLYNSLGVLDIMALSDEFFSRVLEADDFIRISTVKSLMEIIGTEHFED